MKRFSLLILLLTLTVAACGTNPRSEKPLHKAGFAWELSDSELFNLSPFTLSSTEWTKQMEYAHMECDRERLDIHLQNPGIYFKQCSIYELGREYVGVIAFDLSGSEILNLNISVASSISSSLKPTDLWPFVDNMLQAVLLESEYIKASQFLRSLDLSDPEVKELLLNDHLTLYGFQSQLGPHKYIVEVVSDQYTEKLEVPQVKPTTSPASRYPYYR